MRDRAAALAVILAACTSATPPPAPAPPAPSEHDAPSTPDRTAFEAALAETAPLVEEAKRARAGQDLPLARAKVAEAVRALLAADPGATDGPLAERLAELGWFAFEVHDLPTARDAWTALCAYRDKTLPEESPLRWKARFSLASAYQSLGDVRKARELYEPVLSILESTVPDDDPELQRVRANLAGCYMMMGDLGRARSTYERVLEVRVKKLPPEHRDVQRVRLNLASVLQVMGHVREARALQLQVVEVLEKTAPDDDLELVKARLNLAQTSSLLGDHVTARAIEERVLAYFEKNLPDDHPTLQEVRNSLAVSLRETGDLPGSKALQEKVVAIDEAKLPPDHPYLQAARMNLAAVLKTMGDLEGARTQEEKVVESGLPDDSPFLQKARTNLAGTLFLLGDSAASAELDEQALAVCERILPADHPDLARILRDQLWKLRGTEERERIAYTARRLTDCMRATLESVRFLSPHERVENLASLGDDVNSLLSLCDDTDPLGPSRAEIFELLETLRARSLSPPLDSSLADEPAVQRARDARKQLADAVSQGGGAAAPSPDTIARLVRLRDEAERELSGLLSARGQEGHPIAAAELARALGPRSCAVGVRRYTRFDPDPEQPRLVRETPSLVAFVLEPDAELRRIELGPLEPVASAVAEWRTAIGQPVASRGVAAGGAAPPRSSEAEVAATRRLRQLVLDPILAAAGDVEEIHLCADDVLLLVPFDALPEGAGSAEQPLLGERRKLCNESSFDRLLHRRDAAPSGGSLLAVGGIDYGETSSDRGAGWTPLAGSATEVREVAQRYESASGETPTVLVAADATRERLRDCAKGSRFLHVATHGFFAPDGIPTLGDLSGSSRGAAVTESGVPFGVREAVRGMAPMALCGLVLAGANRSDETPSAAPGILTAEELAGFDLARCELAVLSACETNVGILHAGQGIQSLEAALHAAGARTAITSLWKVDDAATSELFADFYARIWERKESKAEALWGAKMALRARGHPTSHWAAWVLTGDPR